MHKKDVILFPHLPSTIWLIVIGLVFIILIYFPLHQWVLAATPSWLYKSVALYLDPFIEAHWGLLSGGIAFIVLGSLSTLLEIRDNRRIEAYSEFLQS